MAEEELLRAALGLLDYLRKTENITRLLRYGPSGRARATGRVNLGHAGRCRVI
jgi:hypothetical protein